MAEEDEHVNRGSQLDDGRGRDKRDLNFNGPQAVSYGGFWIRVAATLIDSLWLIALVGTLLWLLLGIAFADQLTAEQGLSGMVINYGLPFLLTLAFWIYKGATPGKMMLNLRIVDAESLGPVSPGRLILRYFCYYVSGIPFMLGFLWVAFDKRKQGWHDKLAGTVVISD
ncbi:MAG: RDD family protein [Pseudomonadales bacterium]|nr:RDD family protein [Pseudomonadales bacterium]